MDPQQSQDVVETTVGLGRLSLSEEKEDGDNLTQRDEEGTMVSIARDDRDIPVNYIHTRNHNIRCFPNCLSATHSKTSFCGESVFVNVSGSKANKDTLVVGEFRPKDAKRSLSINQEVSSDFLDDKRFYRATHVGPVENFIRFSFNPNRKWNYKVHKRDRALTKLHVFTIYCVVDKKVVGITESADFTLTPIWKLTPGEADDTESEPDSMAREFPEPIPSHIGLSRGVSVSSTGLTSSVPAASRPAWQPDSHLMAHVVPHMPAVPPPQSLMAPSFALPQQPFSAPPHLSSNPFPMFTLVDPNPSPLYASSPYQDVSTILTHGTMPRHPGNFQNISPFPPQMAYGVPNNPPAHMLPRMAPMIPPMMSPMMSFPPPTMQSFHSGMHAPGMQPVQQQQTFPAFAPMGAWNHQVQHAAAFGAREEESQRKKCREGFDGSPSRRL